MRKKKSLSELNLFNLFIKNRCKLMVILFAFLILFCPFVKADSVQNYGIYNATEVENSDIADYSIYNYDDGDLTQKNYKFSLDMDYMNTRYSYINWSIEPSGLKISFPNSDVFLGYSTTNIAPDRLTVVTSDVRNNLFENLSSNRGGAIINNDTGSSYSINSTFIKNSANSDGGAIYNGSGCSFNNIESIFVYNSSSSGGAIYNKGTITNLSSDFIMNSSAKGGAIYNDNRVNVNYSTFIGNYVSMLYSVYGGAVYNDGTATILDTAFVGNYSYSSDASSYGGAIYNISEIKSITGCEFIKNYSRSQNYSAYGGAIYNDDKIGAIVSDFKENYALGTNAYGGAIYNASKRTISSITGEFNNNSVVYANNVSDATLLGGAIYNEGTITNGIINSSFYGNYVMAPSGSRALGGAIYTLSSLKLVADNYTSVFSGNYTQKAGGIKDYNDIYVDYPQGIPTTLTLSAINGGIFVFDDSINGNSGYTLRLESPDNTGSFRFNSLIRNASVIIDKGTVYPSEQTFGSSPITLNSGKISLADNMFKTHSFFGFARGTSNVVVEIDLNCNSDESVDSDFLQIGSFGTQMLTIYIDKINMYYDGHPLLESDALREFTKDVVTQNINVKVELNDEIKKTSYYLGDELRYVGVYVPAVLDFNDKVYENYERGVNYGHIKATSNRLSLVADEETVWTGEYISDIEASGGTLYMLNNLETVEDRVFKSSDVSDVYVVTSPLGVTAKGSLKILGTQEDRLKSTINMNSFSGFQIKVLTDFDVKNVRFVGADTVGNGSVFNIINGVSSLNFENVEFLNNTSTGNGGAVSNYANIDNLIADFKNNSSGLYGGALYNTGEINTINGVYESNYTTGTNRNGGAVSNAGYIKTIENSSFKNNSSSFSGGAIYNTGTIDNISAEFVTNRSNQSGGAITNNSEIGVISNSYFRDNGINARSSAYGGAIYNIGSITSIINSSFVENYSVVDNTFGKALGGAIYTKTSLDFVANNGYEMLFSGNVVRVGVNSTNISNAIYVDSSTAVLTFDITEASKLIFNDVISGLQGFKVVVKGDETGKAQFNNSVNAVNFESNDVSLSFSSRAFSDVNLVLKSGVVDFQDDVTTNYYVNSINISEDVNFNLDIISREDYITYDSLTISKLSNSSGVLVIDSINFDYDTLPKTSAFLKIVTSGDMDLACNFNNITHKDSEGNIELLANNFAILDADILQDTVVPINLNFEDIVYKDLIKNHAFAHFELGEMDEVDNRGNVTGHYKGIAYIVENFPEAPVQSDVVMGDTLKLICNLRTNEEKVFSATSLVNKYYVTDTIFYVYDKMTLRGVDSESEINFTSDRVYQGFDLAEGCVLTLDNIKLTGNDDYLMNVTHQDVVVNLKDATVDGNIITPNLSFGYNLFVSGENTTVLKGSVGKASVNLDSGKLRIMNSSLSKAELIFKGGILDLVDESLDRYEISTVKVPSGIKGLLNIDIDLLSGTSDVINITNRFESSGVLCLDNINIIGTVQDMLARGLNGVSILVTNSPVVLELSDRAKLCLDRVAYDLTTISDEIFDDIVQKTKWNHVYNRHVDKTGDIYELKLSDTKKELVVQKSTVSGRFETSLGDTLHLVNIANISDKSFYTDEVLTYYVSEDLGQTVGELTISGVEGATISLVSKDGYDVSSGFELVSGSKLHLDSFNLIGRGNVILVKDSSAELSLNNLCLRGDIASENNIIYDLNISGESVIDGVVSNARVGLKNSTVTFNSNTFADENTSVQAVDTNFNFIDGEYVNYEINNLSMGDNVLFNLDLNFETGEADKLRIDSFRVGSSKVFRINDINIFGEVGKIFDFDEIIVLESNGGTLELSSTVLQKLDTFSVNTDSVISYEYPMEFGEVVDWNDVLTTIKDTSAKYTIDLNNDKTGFKLNVVEDVKASYTDGYSLALYNQFSELEEKTYSTNVANKIQNVVCDLGETYGKLTVEGVVLGSTISTINLRNNSGFILGENSIGLTLKSVKFTSQNPVVNSLNPEAELVLSDVLFETSADSSIITVGDVTVRATSNNKSEFVNRGGVDVSFVGNGEKNLNLYAQECSTIQLKSGISFGEQVDLNVNINEVGQDSGTVKFSFDNNVGTVETPLNQLNLGGGTFDIKDDNFTLIYTDELKILDDTEFDFDIDCSNNLGDRFVVSKIYTENVDGKKLVLDVNNINFIDNKYDVMKHKLLNLFTATSDFIELVGADGGSIYLGDDGNVSYYLRLGLHGSIVIEDNRSYANNPLVLAVKNPSPTKYVLSQSMSVNNYGVGDDGKLIKLGDIESKKLTIKGKNNSRFYTTNEITGFVLDGSSTVPATKQQLVMSGLTMTGFDGAIINRGGKVSLSSVNFVSNESEGNGAVIRNILAENNYKGTVSLTGKKKTYARLVNNLASGNGGAIYNEGKLTLKYVQAGSDRVNANTSINGGVLYNAQISSVPTSVSITSSSFDFNKAIYDGGAIYTTGALKSSKNSYINNNANNGGAIYINGSNDKISKVSFGSDKFNLNEALYGGAFYIESGLVNISKTYFGTVDYNKGNKAEFCGGAIYNSGNTINNLTKVTSSKFYGNNAGFGGAIYNTGVLEDKKSVYSYNYAFDTDGGAIYNEAGGRFTTSSTTFSYNNSKENGGAIYNGGIIIARNKKFDVVGGLTSSKFISNTAQENGGAIYNEGQIVLKKSIFTDNSAKLGGGIYNCATLEFMGSTFTGNIADSFGGAIYNENKITMSKVVIGKKDTVKKGIITNNSNEAQNGGGIYNEGNIKDNKSTYTNNYAKADGGGLYNNYSYLSTGVKFVGNIAEHGGGAIYNGVDGVIYEQLVVTNGSYRSDYYNYGGIMTSTFTSNKASFGGAIYNEGLIYIGRSSFKTNVADNNGGAIWNNSILGAFGSTFSKNSAENGGAIYSEQELRVDEYLKSSISKKGKQSFSHYASSFTSNSAKNGGAIYIGGGSLDVRNTTFKSNTATVDGGALYLGDGTETIISDSKFIGNSADKGGAIYVSDSANLTITDTSFTNNKATRFGGAIFMDLASIVTIEAISKDVVFSGNKAGKLSNSIYMSEGSILNLIALSNKKITIKDNIAGKDATINIRTVNQGLVNIANESALKDMNVVVQGRGSLVSTQNNIIGTTMFTSLCVEDDANLKIDMNLQSKTSDKIQAETVEGAGVLNVSGVNVVTNSKTPVEIKVGEDSIVSSMTATKAESAEATYKLKSYYDENGLLRAVVYGQKAKPSAVASPVATQLGGYLTQINSYDQAFMNMDLNMVFPRDARELSGKWKVENGKCCHPEQSEGSRDSSAMPQNDGISYNAKGLWNRPYATFERVNLNNGPKVSNVGYGNFFGGDADVKQLKNGWKRQFSAYVGYNGSVQDYDRQSIDQNGGTVGITEVWYKNNFFSGLTVNAGANIAQAHTDLGRENIPMFMTGIASKTGYNFEFNRGKFIVQPSFLMSYSFIHTFEHENGKGSHVGSSPLNAIQVVPSIKFIANLKNGWQPYFNVNMRWNIIDKTHFSLRDVGIPEMSIDPYVEYGIGLQRRWGERFTGYGQAMIRNGGRNGVMLSFGFKWLL